MSPVVKKNIVYSRSTALLLVDKNSEGSNQMILGVFGASDAMEGPLSSQIIVVRVHKHNTKTCDDSVDKNTKCEAEISFLWIKIRVCG